MKQARTKTSPLRFLTLWTVPIVLRDLIAMTIYVALLLPGFIQMLWFYVRNHDRVAVSYQSSSCRNTLDVYGRPIDVYFTQQQQRPVVLFLPGGAFLIGYKMWAALFAQALSTFDVLVVAADYRNYPFGVVPDMIEDVQDVIQWTLDHCHEYGGNPDKVVVVGQSAGAHLGMIALLRKSQEHEKQYNIKGFIGLSGIFDLSDASDVYAHHGLNEAFVEEQLFGNELRQCDPTQVLADEANVTDNLPPIEIWHGTADKTVDWRSSKAFASKLEQSCNTHVHFKSYPNWTHTDAIIEAIFEGNHTLHHDICRCVETWCDVKLDFQPPSTSPRCPKLLVQLARKFSPF